MKNIKVRLFLAVASIILLMTVIININAQENGNKEIIQVANKNLIDTYVKENSNTNKDDLVEIPNAILNNKALGNTYNVSEPGQISNFIDDYYLGNAWGAMMLIMVDGE